MLIHYKRFNLIKDKYFIEYIYNREDSSYAYIYFTSLMNLLPSKKAKTSKLIGKVVTYYESQPTSETERPNWRADCHLWKEHINKDFIDAIGKELLKRTSCKEPFVINAYVTGLENSDCIVYGDLYRED